MEQITVLFDPKCGLCRRVQAWAAEQPKYVEMNFVPVNSEEAWHRYPHLNHARTLTDLTVVSDRGAVYWGPKAWLMCLWALKRYRSWSLRLSKPDLLPTVRRVMSAISRNRYDLEGVGKILLRPR
jgi:predicted DCC family thiol-disulfide oxidoreductase YuxK